MASGSRATRFGVLAAVAIVLFGLLGSRLWFLQAVEADDLRASLEAERTKVVPLIPERGRIFDADGRILADNERRLNIAVDWAVIADEDDRAELFRRLSGWVNVPVKEMERRYNADVYDPRLPLPLAEDVDEDIAIAIRERAEDFPGVQIIEDWKRTYPYAPLASHVLGYMGRLSPEEVDKYTDKGYQLNEVIGKAGVELSMEDQLHGKWGKIVYEVNAAGRILRQLRYVPPVPGRDIQLSIDLDVQQYAEQVLQTQLERIRNFPTQFQAENFEVEDPNTGITQRMDPTKPAKVPFPAKAGSVVVMNQQNGQVAAMASYPTYDNRWFGSGASGERLSELFPQDVPPDEATLVNRAVQGQYNLGSTFKPFTAYAATAGGVWGPHDRYNDTGYYQIQSIDSDRCATGVDCELRNAWCSSLNGPCRYGSVDLYQALAVSSDTYFYHLGEEMYLADRGMLKRGVDEFGFGSETGIDLPYEFDSRVPNDAVKKRLVEAGVLAEGEEPRLLVGDNIQASIGQGLLAATPTHLAVAYAALGNGGKVLVPHVVRAIYEPGVPDGRSGYADLSRGKVIKQFMKPHVRNRVDFPPETHDAIVGGLRRNITGPGFGERSTTSQELFEDGLYPADAIPIAGKTGTAQGSGNLPWNDSSVFAAFSMDPERPYTVTSYLERAGYGSRGSAPLVKCMYMALSGLIPTDPVQISDPLDIENDPVAEPAGTVDDSCMRATNFDPFGTGAALPEDGLD